MIKITKHGNTASIRSAHCDSCGCEFEFDKYQDTFKDKIFDSRAGVNIAVRVVKCPECGNEVIESLIFPKEK